MGRLDMLRELTATADRLAAVIEPLNVDALDRRPEPDSWSLRETLTHLAASEPPFRERLERMVAEDDPFLPGFGPEVARPDSELPGPDPLACFRSDRAGLVAFLADLPPEAWDRIGTHEVTGRTTLTDQVRVILEHDVEHLGQLTEVGSSA